MFDRQAKYALIAAALVLIVSRAAFSYAQWALGAVLKKQRVDLREAPARIPTHLKSWRAISPDQLMDASVLETLGTSVYLSRIYAPLDDDGPPVHLHIAYYTGLIDPVPHVPDRCFEAAGLTKKELPRNLALPLDDSAWTIDPGPPNRATGERYRLTTARHPLTLDRMEVAMPVGEFELRTTPFLDERQPHLNVYAGYFFIANGRTTPTPDRVRLLAFDLRERHAYYCKVQLTVSTPSAMTQDQFVEYSARFLNELLPDLMRCLPDWREVESSGAPPAP